MEDFKIDLRDVRLKERHFTMVEDDAFFERIGGIITRGNVRTEVTLAGVTGETFQLLIKSEGTVTVPCDRCLADVDLRIQAEDTLAVRMGDDYADDGEVLTVPRREGVADISQPVYEFIALAMPLQRVHQPGMCDTQMLARLAEHQAARSGEEGTSSESEDARWQQLRQLAAEDNENINQNK